MLSNWKSSDWEFCERRSSSGAMEVGNRRRGAKLLVCEFVSAVGESPTPQWRRSVMPVYMKKGNVPRKRHIKFPRENGSSFKGEGIHYEHVITTQGFDRAYSITYHLRPPTRIRKCKNAGTVELKAVTNNCLRHHHSKSFDLPRKGDPIRGRVPMLFNEDLAAWRC